MFSGLLVNVTHMDSKRLFKLAGISNVPACRQTFVQRVYDKTTNVAQEKEMSVADYFQTTYQSLRFPNLPCALSGAKARRIYLPLEVL